MENPEYQSPVESFLEQKEKMMFTPSMGVTLDAILQPKVKYHPVKKELHQNEEWPKQPEQKSRKRFKLSPQETITDIQFSKNKVIIGQVQICISHKHLEN